MRGPGHDWRTILLVVASTAAALLAFVLAGSMVAYAALGPAILGTTLGSPKPLQLVVLASAVALIGALFVAASYYGIQSLLGHQAPDYAPKPLRSWQWAGLLCLWIFSAVTAQVLSQERLGLWLSPAFYLVAIGTPAYFFVRQAAGGLQAGSRRRIWGILATAMAAGTGLALLVELAFMILGLLAAGIYLALHPTQLAVLQQFASQLTGASGSEDFLVALKPLLEQPLVLLLVLLIVSGLVPMIEETAKAVAVCAIFDHLESQAQGFVAGALSGAGFALVESLLASSTPDSNWSLSLVVRAGSTMMHIVATSLTGWGIAAFRGGKPAARSLGAYAIAIALHSLWNASVVLVAFGGVRTASPLRPTDALGTALMVLGGAVLSLLCITMPIALAAINRRLRAATDSERSQPSTGGPLPGGQGQYTSTAAARR